MNRRVALVIGVGSYIYYPSLKYCPPSAEDVFELLVSPDLGCCDPDQSVLTTIGEGETLTLVQLDDTVRGVVDSLETGDQFVFYFCGHGRVSHDDFFLLVTDSPKVGRFGLRSYDFSTLARVLKYGKVRKAILIVDTCHSGAMVESMKDFMDGADWSPHDLPPGIAYMAATGEIHSARQEPRFERTLFSYYFCNGVRNWSKTDTPYITPSELRKHINDQLKKNHPEDKQRAHTWIGEGESDVWISLNPSYQDTTPERMATVTTGPFAPYDKNVDYHIRIHQEGSKYIAEILVEGQILRIPIRVSPHDLAALNKRFQGELVHFVGWYVDEDKITLPEAKARLLPLAELGHYAFKLVFDNPEAFEVIEGIITSERGTSTQIISEDFLLPWDWLYPFSLDEPLSFDHFWGMNHIISRVIPQNRQFKISSTPAIEVTSQAKVGLITDVALPAVFEREIPFFERLAGDNRIELLKLIALDPTNRAKEIKQLRAFLHNAFDLIHIACHAWYDEDAPSSSTLIVSDDFRISLMDIEVYDISMNGHPFVILNAITGAGVNPMYYLSFPASFLRHGARGVIAPEGILPDDFAAAFTAQLYQHLLEGMPIGQSLLAVRRYFWETSANPLGLLYSIFGSFSTRLA